jgi:hypothetical protein
LFSRWKFTILLGALLLLMVAHPLLREETVFFSLFYDFFLILVFLGAILFLFQRRHSRAAALILGIPAVASIITHYLLPGTSPAAKSLFFHLIPVAFLLYTVTSVLWTIFLAREVSADAIIGALCGYLLIGLAFGHVYCLVESFLPGSFHLAAHVGPLPADEDRRHTLLTYFSLCTLTTLGFGDISPQSPPARTFAWMEAVIGQFYVAVIIAELIGLKVSSSIRERTG